MALSDWWPWIVFPTFSTYQVMKIILNCSSVFKQQPNEYARVEFLKSLYTWLPEHSRLMHSLIILCLQTTLKNKIKTNNKKAVFILFTKVYKFYYSRWPSWSGVKSILAGYFHLYFRNHSRGYLCVPTGFVWYVYLFWGSTTSQRIVRLREFYSVNTTIWWLSQCLCLLLSSRWFRLTTSCHLGTFSASSI